MHELRKGIADEGLPRLHAGRGNLDGEMAAETVNSQTREKVSFAEAEAVIGLAEAFFTQSEGRGQTGSNEVPVERVHPVRKSEAGRR